MDIAIIENCKPLGFGVWITDIIKMNAGMGDMFDTQSEALDYAQEHEVQVLDLSHIESPMLEESEALRSYFDQYLELTPEGEIVAVKSN